MCVLLNGAIPAQVAMASGVASLSSPPAMGVQWCVHVCACMHVCVCVCVCMCVCIDMCVCVCVCVCMCACMCVVLQWLSSRDSLKGFIHRGGFHKTKAIILIKKMMSNI